MVRKKRDTSEKRESIVRAAIEAFSEEGYDTTSMDRIAERAGASKRTVYNHFPSKEALFDAVVECFQEEAPSPEDLCYRPDDALEPQLAAFAGAKVDLLDDPLWLGMMKVGMGVVIRDPELAQRAMESADAEGRVLVEWLAAAAEDGRMRIEDPERAARLFMAMVKGALFWPQVLHGPLDPGERKRIQGELVDLFLARYRA